MLTYTEKYKMPNLANESEIFFAGSEPEAPSLAEQTLNLQKIG